MIAPIRDAIEQLLKAKRQTNEHDIVAYTRRSYKEVIDVLARNAEWIKVDLSSPAWIVGLADQQHFAWQGFLNGLCWKSIPGDEDEGRSPAISFSGPPDILAALTTTDRRGAIHELYADTEENRAILRAAGFVPEEEYARRSKLWQEV